MIFPDKTGLEPACGNAKEVDVQNTMTVKQLKEILSNYPDDMIILTTMCSDYTDLPFPKVIEVLPNWSNQYYAHFYPDQHPSPPTKEVIKVLHFRGN